jgi:hypothetical protein
LHGLLESGWALEKLCGGDALRLVTAFRAFSTIFRVSHLKLLHQELGVFLWNLYHPWAFSLAHPTS